jgi:deoxyribodipyrimidine photolyase
MKTALILFNRDLRVDDHPLESVRGRAILCPWAMDGFGRIDYPAPLVDHDEAAAAFKAHRE